MKVWSKTLSLSILLAGALALPLATQAATLHAQAACHAILAAEPSGSGPTGENTATPSPPSTGSGNPGSSTSGSGNTAPSNGPNQPTTTTVWSISPGVLIIAAVVILLIALIVLAMANPRSHTHGHMV